MRIINESDASWDELELELIDTGAQDILKEEEGITIYTNSEDLQPTKKFLEDKGIKTESAEIEYVAKEGLEVSEADKDKLNKFTEALEDNEDVTDYYTNVLNI